MQSDEDKRRYLRQYAPYHRLILSIQKMKNENAQEYCFKSEEDFEELENELGIAIDIERLIQTCKKIKDFIETVEDATQRLILTDIFIHGKGIKSAEPIEMSAQNKHRLIREALKKINI